MADRAKKISELPVLTAPAAEDLLVIVDSPSSNAITKQVTVGNLFSNTSANVVIKDGYALNANLANITTARVMNIVVARKQTPSGSINTADNMGSIWFDDDYIYVATANGVIKRATLSTF